MKEFSIYPSNSWAGTYVQKNPESAAAPNHLSTTRAIHSQPTTTITFVLLFAIIDLKLSNVVIEHLFLS